MSSGEKEVHAFLETIGLEHYASSLINTGFYTSLNALTSARRASSLALLPLLCSLRSRLCPHSSSYEELMDCNVKPVHAKLIIASLRSKAPSTPAAKSEEHERGRMASFLSGVGLEICQEALAQAGLVSLESLQGTLHTVASTAAACFTTVSCTPWRAQLQ